jgi:DNA-binding NarL/FixJ family response regulator
MGTGNAPKRDASLTLVSEVLPTGNVSSPAKAPANAAVRDMQRDHRLGSGSTRPSFERPGHAPFEGGARLSEASTERITAVVADDHPALLTAVSEVLSEHGIGVIGRASNGDEALAKIEARKPRVALLDVRMPRMGGIQVAERARQTAPETAVLLYTAYGDRALLSEALDAGVRAFVLKEAPLGDLVRAVDLVAGGGTYVDPVLAGALVNAKLKSDLPELTQREREVLRSLADGLSNEQIGKRLFISPETVRTHVRKAMAKLDADTRTQAVATALRQSLIA